MRAITSRDQHDAELTQHRQRTLVGDPGDARHHQRERNGQPAAFQREGQRQRQRCDRAAGIDRGGRGAAGRMFGDPAFRSRSRTRRRAAAPARRTGSSARIARRRNSARSASARASAPHAAPRSSPNRDARIRPCARKPAAPNISANAVPNSRCARRPSSLGDQRHRGIGTAGRGHQHEIIRRRPMRDDQKRERARPRPARASPFRFAMQRQLWPRTARTASLAPDGSWRFAITSSNAPNR